MSNISSTSEIDNLYDDNAIVGQPATANHQATPPSTVPADVANDQVGENDLVDGDDEQYESVAPERKKRKRIRMMCFSCNRPDGHYLSIRPRWLYSFLLGLTFGLIHLVGPFRCQCCGSARLMPANWLNLRYWARTLRDQASSGSSRSRR